MPPLFPNLLRKEHSKSPRAAGTGAAGYKEILKSMDIIQRFVKLRKRAF